METNLFDYDLPRELIAQQPAEPRDAARLLVVHRRSGRFEHRHFRDLPDYLEPPDVLILNNTRVIPARLIGRRPGGGRVELLLVRPRGKKADNRWEAMARPARRLSAGCRLSFGAGELEALVLEELAEGRRVVEFRATGPVEEALRRFGAVPLPPYIHRPAPMDRYQTVYARHEGSVAAPTAGLHFTPELLAAIKRRGVATAALVLHVGPGTFRPVQAAAVEAHRMDKEFYRLSPTTAQKINQARASRGRVVAAGTTVVRSLETVAAKYGGIKSSSGWTGLFIYPGYRFRAVDMLITNFHLPRSTLLMLVCAFAGRELTMEAYRVAVAQRYRFYSFGDAMLII